MLSQEKRHRPVNVELFPVELFEIVPDFVRTAAVFNLIACLLQNLRGVFQLGVRGVFQLLDRVVKGVAFDNLEFFIIAHTHAYIMEVYGNENAEAVRRR